MISAGVFRNSRAKEIDTHLASVAPDISINRTHFMRRDTDGRTEESTDRPTDGNHFSFCARYRRNGREGRSKGNNNNTKNKEAKFFEPMQIFMRERVDAGFTINNQLSVLFDYIDLNTSVEA